MSPLRAWISGALFLSALCGTAQAQKEATEPDCGCLWRGSFSEVAPSSDLVIRGVVDAIKGNAVDLSSIEVLKGEFWLDSTRVWMKTGNYCRPPVTEFPLGSSWIMALERIDTLPEGGFNPSTPNQSYGRVNDYILSSCGGYWLRVNGETVRGNLVPDMPRFYHDPDMSPVLLELVSGFLEGRVSQEALIEASREREEADSLILNTRSFLRGQDDWLDAENEAEQEDRSNEAPTPE